VNQNPGGLGYTGGITLPSYVGITLNYYKDPYYITNQIQSVQCNVTSVLNTAHMENHLSSTSSIFHIGR